LAATLALFAAGPALDHAPGRLIDAALAANPIVAMAAAAKIDIFHGELLYQLSPLAHTQIHYPASAGTIGGYGAGAVALFTGAAGRLRRTASSSVIERIAA
jgi:hypothetical protein